jgi:alpha-galactosidase
MTRILLGISLFFLPTGLTRADDETWVSIDDEKGMVTINAPGLPAFKGSTAATIQTEKGNHRINSAGLNAIAPLRETITQTPFGKATLSTATWTTPNPELQLTLRLKRLHSLRAFTLQAILHNGGAEDVNLRELVLFDQRNSQRKGLGFESPTDWLVTPLMEDTLACSLAEAEKSYNEAIMIYHKSQRGFLIGPVGPAEAYTNVEVRNQRVSALVRMDDVLVKAGESRRSEEMIFCFESPETATDVWTRWVATTHKARIHRGPVYGWCSWYDRTTKIDEAHVRDVTKTIKDNPDVFGKGIIQIDDGYQKMDGDWSANEKFPSGMSALASEIRNAGCIPGVWFAPLMIHPDHPFCKEHPEAIQTNAKGIASFMNPNPFHPAGANWLNPDHPESKKHLFNIIRDARDRGYGYIKIDFNGIGNRFVDPTKTRLQIFRELYTLYREAAGEDIYILSCLGQPTRGVVGFIDSARVGPDSHPAHFDKCLNSVLRFQIFDNVWWQNDPDVSYLATKLESRRVGYTPQGEGMWRTWHNINTLVGGTAMISEPINKPDVQKVWRNYEIMRPGSAEPAKLLTLGTSPKNTIFGFAASRPYGDFAVYNLYNSHEHRTHLTLRFKEAGIPTETECAVFDFWKNKVIARTKGSFNTPPLDPLSSSLLRITALDSTLPILVGSNLHLSMGATEIDNLIVSEKQISIHLNDAGARTGSLTFFSKDPLSPISASNCSITGIENLGDQFWRINLDDREWGAKQVVRISIENSATPQAKSP